MTSPLVRFAAFADRAAWRPVLVFLVLGAITQGIGFATVVPIVDSLLGGGISWGWIAVLAVVTVVHAVLHHRSVPMGNDLGADVVTALAKAIDERIAAAPAQLLRPEHADRLSTLSGYSVVVLMGLPAHVLRPLVAAVVTPPTVVVVLASIEPWLAVVTSAGALVVAAVTWLALRLLTSTADPDSVGWLDRVRDQRSTAPPARVLRLAAGDVLPWRSLELLNCAAVATCVALAAGGGVPPAKAVALIVLSVLMVRPMMEAVLLTSTVLNSHDVLERVEPLMAGPVRPGAPWPSDCDVEFDGVVLADGADAVSFRLPDGSTTAVTGASDGLRLALSDLLAGDALPSAGRVRVGGADVADLSQTEAANRVARVSATAPDLTADEAKRFVEMDPLLPENAQEELSRLRAAVVTGDDLPEADRWRLALLRATAQDPAIVIVDATAGSSALGEPGLSALLTGLVRNRTSWLLWAPGTAAPVCDRVLAVGHATAEVR
ncbi:hypothetical protein ACPZ19_50180 [Amycolatopsis lurida]